MEYFISFFLLLSGFTVLFLGGECLVRSAIQFAKKWKVSSLFIGLTLVSIGTSAPELFASLAALIENKPSIALGNIIGSNIFNLLMILGLTAFFTPLIIEKSLMKFEWVFLFLSSLFFTLSLRNSSILWHEGLFFLTLFLIFLLFSFYRVKKKTLTPMNDQTQKSTKTKKIFRETKEKKSLLKLFYLLKTQIQSFSKKYFLLFYSLTFFSGIAFLSLGAKIALIGAVDLGRAAGISEAIIGIVIISIGTGLPELVTSTVAAFKSETDLAISNVIGSNIMNTLGITSMMSLVLPIHFKQTFLFQESLIMMGITFLFFPLAWITKFKFKRKIGFFLILIYAIYLWTRF